MTLIELIHEQVLDYSSQLKEVEAEIVRKYKSDEYYSGDLIKANGLKMLIKEAMRFMAEKA